jgi:tryptophanase
MIDFPAEPYRIKTVEAIKRNSRDDRERIIKGARFNVFKVPAEDIYIDFLTDSGTSAMSDNQWAGIMTGDESYAGCKNYFHFEETLRDITGFRHIIPIHQGRAGEHIFYSSILKPGDKVPSNTHFDTTRANIEYLGAEAVDLLIDEGRRPDCLHPFKGNINLDRLEAFIKENKGRVPVATMTITNNTGGGQPASLENIKKASDILHAHGIPFILDACRYAENSYFVKMREHGQMRRGVREIARDIFSCADGCIMSAKKDGLANIGGFIGLNNDGWHKKVTDKMILVEGYRTYGGLAGRDLEAITRGIVEALDENYLAHRTGQIYSFGELLKSVGVPIIEPTGGHAVFVDVLSFLRDIPREHLPGWGLTVALYREGSIRAVEIGTVMFGKRDKSGKTIFPPVEYVRLAVPRRVYTESHLKYVSGIFARIASDKKIIRGLRITYEPQFLRHFTAEFEEL